MTFLFGKRLWRIVALVLIIALPLYYFTRGDSAEAKFVTAPVTRGPIVRSVIATGTVNPVVTVQVGSYVSGPITAIYADFNAPVKAGQLIAKIDPRPFQVKVEESAATLANAKAQVGKDQADLAYKELTFQRNQRLFAAEAVSRDAVDNARSAFLQAQSQVAVDRAMVEQQLANLHDAQVNLNYSNIVSPVDGTIVSRNVDVGQTVASSFQTPTLFLIAKDLTKMQVDTNVSESDIGNIHSGQSAIFTVDAFPEREFAATVGQVRQAPITVQNVVTYDVVVEVANPELLLKPGMTANVTIVTAKRDHVMRIPMQGVRFSPAHRASSTVATLSEPPARSNQARVWLDDGGTLKPVTVTTGLDDGNNIEILNGALKPGDRVVTEQTRGASGAASGRSPLRMTRF
jgi:HlyD family secretion protein